MKTKLLIEDEDGSSRSQSVIFSPPAFHEFESVTKHVIDLKR